MRTFASAAGLAALLLFTASSSFASPPAAAKGAPGTMVIVFKDGHRQAINLSDIERVEYPSGETADSFGGTGPSRGRFIGKWDAGDGMGGTFTITLREDGDAMRSIGDVHGRWVYVDGEAHITWDDGAEDAIRRVGSRYQKFAYKAGKAFTDIPDNVTNAHNTTQKPI
jgi:hypothetical protein